MDLPNPTSLYISSTEAAKRYGFTNDHITLLCRRGKVEGMLMGGRFWLVNEESFKAYLVKTEEERKKRDRALSKQITSEPQVVGAASMPVLAAVPQVVAPRVKKSSFAKLGVAFVLAGALYVYAAPLHNILVQLSDQYIPASVVSVSAGVADWYLSFIDKVGDLQADSYRTLGAGIAQVVPGVSPGELAAAASTNTAAVWNSWIDWLAQKVFPYDSKILAQQPALSTQTQNTLPSASTQAPAVIKTPPAAAVATSTRTAPAPIVRVTQVVQGVTEDRLADQLQKLSNELKSLIFTQAGAPGPVFLGGGTSNALALTQRIDKLNGVTITGSTISGYLPTSGGTVSSLTVTGTAALSALANCDTIDTDASGNLSCGTDSTGSGATFPFTSTTNFGALSNSTSTPVWFTAGLQASSTSHLVAFDFNNATGTALAVTGTASTTNFIVSSAGGTGTRCAQFDSVGTLSANASACGSGSGGSDFTYTTIDSAVTAATTSPLAVFGAAYFGSTGTTTLTSAGLLGVGTTTPFAALQIATTTGKNFVLSDSGAGANLKHWLLSSLGGSFSLGTTTDAYATSSMAALTILNNGNVGFGTTTPYAKLSVHAQNGETNGTLFAISSSTSAATTNFLTVSNKGVFSVGADGSNAFTVDSINGSTTVANLSIGDLVFDTNAGMVSLSNLPVNILSATGTQQSQSISIDDNPVLTVYAESDGLGSVRNTSVGVGTTSPWGQLSIAATQTASSTNNKLFIIASSTAAGVSTTFFSVNNIGNVGVGTSTPFSKLTINSDNAIENLFQIATTTNQGVFVVNNIGNVGAGTTTPWRTFSVGGTVGFAGLTAGAGAGALCLDANNEVTYSAGAGCTVSSLRFKHDIATLDSASGLAELLQLNPVSFIYNDDIGVPGVQVGFIAEEVHLVDPRLVAYDKDSLPYTVKYQNMVAVTIKAVQELYATVKGFAEQFTTKKLCVEDVCVTRDQFLQMTQTAGVAASVPTPPPAPEPPVPSSVEGEPTPPTPSEGEEESTPPEPESTPLEPSEPPIEPEPALEPVPPAQSNEGEPAPQQEFTPTP